MIFSGSLLIFNPIEFFNPLPLVVQERNQVRYPRAYTWEQLHSLIL